MARFGHLNPYDLHKRLINEYVLKRAGDTALLNQRDSTRDRTDSDVIRENHQFLWDEDEATQLTWEQQLAKKYYDKLFTEYCICDLSRYRENKVALRWRIETEVVSGKGQFICGSKTCSLKETLRSWEVNFGYVEHGERKNALIKLRLCPECSIKLNYRSKKREVKKLKKLTKKQRKIESRRWTSTDLDRSESQAPNSHTPTAEKGSSAENSDDETVASEMLKSEEPSAGNWAKVNSNVEEKSREEEFDEYLEDLLL